MITEICEDFEIGDVVIVHFIKGPKMIVDEIDDDNDDVICIWFDAKDRLQRKAFEKSILRKVISE